MASISLKGIYKIYPGDVTAVSDFNLRSKTKSLSFSSALPAAVNPPRCA